MHRTSWSAGLSVTGEGVGVIAHAGSFGLRLISDRTGLTGALSKAMARPSFIPVHDRGRVLSDVAVMLADGGEAISDINVLRHQSGVLGPVASAPTVWRVLDEATPRSTEENPDSQGQGPPPRLVPARSSRWHPRLDGCRHRPGAR